MPYRPAWAPRYWHCGSRWPRSEEADRMAMVVWIVEGTWPACVDAARAHVPEGADVVLLHVTPADVPGAAHGAFAGLLGRGHPERDPGTRVEQLAAASAGQLLTDAAQRLGRECTRTERTGR